MKKYNTKICISIVMAIILLSMVSALPLSISPSSLSISAYPGEIHYRNITITTDGNYAVYLNHTSNSSDITINYTTPLIVEGTKKVEVGFSFAKDIEPGTYDIDLTASTEYVTITTIINSNLGGSSGGGGGMWIRNAGQVYTPAQLNGTYININGTYYYSNGIRFIRQSDFQLVNQTIIYINESNHTDILDTPVNEQTKGFITLVKDFFTRFWHWIFG